MQIDQALDTKRARRWLCVAGIAATLGIGAVGCGDDSEAGVDGATGRSGPELTPPVSEDRQRLRESREEAKRGLGGSGEKVERKVREAEERAEESREKAEGEAPARPAR